MLENIVVNVHDLTQGVSQQGFGLALAFDHRHDIPYSLITSADDLLTESIDLNNKNVEELKEIIEERGIEVGDALKKDELIKAIEEDIGAMESAGITTKDSIYKLANKLFMHKPRPQQIAVAGKETADVSVIKNELANLIDAGQGDWLYITTTATDDNKVKSLASWALGNKKFYGVTTDNMDLVKEVENGNTWIGYHNDKEDRFAEGLVMNCAMSAPGSMTTIYETVNGSLPAEIGGADRTELHKNNGMTYRRHLGRNFVSNSKMSDGSYIDTAIGAFFIESRLNEELFLLQMSNKKIAFSSEGIAMIEAKCKQVMRMGVENGIILEENGQGVFNIDVKERAELPTNDVANRKYNGIHITATVAGAIENIEINIDLVIEEVGEVA